MDDSQKIAVVFLMWLPYGSKKMEIFLDSYLAFDAGINHDLVVVFKGKENRIDEEKKCLEILARKKVLFHSMYFEGGFDIDTYRLAATQIKANYLFFLNTNSVLMTNQWLLKMYEACKKESIGMVAATGSWQSLRSTVFNKYKGQYEERVGLYENFRRFKMLIKASVYYPFLFASFPNPHLRTNAFMIRRSIFLKLKLKTITSKFNAYLNESGRSGITKQVLKMNLDVLIVDKEGNEYSIQDWPTSRTFWIGEQEQLMVSDNQTELYRNADEPYKRYLNFVAWGK